MKIAIVGFGLEGRSSLNYFSSQGGHEVIVHDQDSNLELPLGIKGKLGEDYLEGLGTYDLIIRTSGLPPVLILSKNPGLEDRITTHLNLFLKACPTSNLLAITGTKGKGTTSTLLARMLEAAGKEVVLAGNIGIPMLDTLADLKPDSFVVLELSSFQLIDLHEASPHIAVCLMVTPEHLNWHLGMDEYVAAKSNLFSHQSPGDKAIYYADNPLSQQIAGSSPGEHIPYCKSPGAYIEGNSVMIEGHHICQTDDVKLLGKHNLQNVCAAVTAAWQVVKDLGAIRSALTSFSGLEHRLEFVKEIDGVKYFDDSFGTTPEAAQVAIESFKQPLVLIAGGSSKKSDYTPMVEAILSNNVRYVVCIGETGPEIAQLLENNKSEKHVPYTVLNSEGGVSMGEIVNAARAQAKAGDVVLLSTGSASFGLFKNYKERGDQFSSYVQSLS